MVKIDLHIHSVYSDDGEFTVKEIMEMSGAENITCLSVTDHNSVRGTEEALALGAELGIRVLSGVELDCVHEGRNLHLLGYHFDHTHPAFAEIEQSILEQEKKAANEKIELIKQELGIPFSAEEVLAAAAGGVVTGELIAEILLAKEDAGRYEALVPYLPGGMRADNHYVNFYWDYFSKGKPAYVPMQYITLPEGIALLHEAGGIAVLAHPGQSLQGDYDFLPQIVDAGIDGMEAYSSYHSRTAAIYFSNLAEQNKLLITCGSDFHGKTKLSIALCGHLAGDKMPAIAEGLERYLAR